MKLMHQINKRTIYALSTCYGKSALAIIRITGTSAMLIFKIFNIKKKISPHIASLVKIFSKKVFIDECIIVFFPKEKSYTGLDLIELQIHGSMVIIKKILHELSMIEGFRIAEPGEFTRLALENNKISYNKAEAILDLINAETESQHHYASRVYNGCIEKLQDKIRNQFIEIISQYEALIDFPDDMQKYEMIAQEQLLELTTSLKQTISSLETVSLLKDGINVCITGARNAGKSTFMNLITQTNRSITSSIEGTTRDIIIDKINILGIPITIYDTAGIGHSNNDIETIGIKKALETLKIANIIVLVHDITKNIDFKLLKIVQNTNPKAPIILINNKLDLIKTSINIEEKYHKQYNIKENIKISLNQKSSYIAINKIIEKIIKNITPTSEGMIITNIRQKSTLQECLQHVERAILIEEIELKIEEIKNGIDVIGGLIGRINSKQVLDKLFEKFCIGK